MGRSPQLAGRQIIAAPTRRWPGIAASADADTGLGRILKKETPQRRGLPSPGRRLTRGSEPRVLKVGNYDFAQGRTESV